LETVVIGILCQVEPLRYHSSAWKYLIAETPKNVHGGLTEKDVRQIHRKPAEETSGSCQIDEPAIESG
jgi:hypothetical protein